MLKRTIAVIRQWLSPDQDAQYQQVAHKETLRASRRGFFRKAALGAASVSGAAGMAKVVVDSVPHPDQKQLYANDARAGEQELAEREYVLMSDQEKREMVQRFIDSYPDQS
ncbi:MAG: hypothetical protein U9Q75_01395 [Pseudomonadota bacterium]|nr:hypothetical protein [Pseudomonadota bacterium]